MFDLDPRDYDDARAPRDGDERHRDDNDELTLGRGPSAPHVEDHHDEPRDRHDDRREGRDGADHRDRDDARCRIGIWIRGITAPTGATCSRQRLLREARPARIRGRE